MRMAMDTLQEGINERQNELRNLVSILGHKAHRIQLVSNILRVMTILLSAIIAARASISAAAGPSNGDWSIVFVVATVVMTALLGLEAAFKFDKRAAELNLLAALARSTVITVDGEWRKKVGSLFDTDLRDALREILTLQEAKLAEIHQKAASLGVNVVLQVRELDNPDREPFAA